MLLQTVGQVDALAVLVESHQYSHVGGRDAADAQVHGIDQPVQAVGGIQFAADQFVAQVGPGRLTLEVQGQAVRLSEPLGGCHHHRGAVAQGHEAEVEAALFRGITAVDPGQRVVHRAVANRIVHLHLPFHSKKSVVPPDGDVSHCE